MIRAWQIRRPYLARRWETLFALSVGLWLLPCDVYPQKALPPEATIRRSVDLVLVDVLVTDSKGNSQKGLHAADFEILDEGNSQEISHFSQDEMPLAIALVVDVSGSMDPMMRPLRNALRDAFPLLKTEDRVALFSFANGSKRRVELTRDVEKLTRTVEGFRASGWTNINDAVYQAAAYLRDASPRARNVIIIVTDTIPTVSGKRRPKEVQDALWQSEVALFGVRVPWQSSPNSDPTFDAEHLAQLASIQTQLIPEAVLVDTLAQESGGFVMDVRRLEGLETTIESLFRILRTRYTLGFYPNPPGKAGSIRKIEVVLKNQKALHTLSGAPLRYRTRYRVPPSILGNGRTPHR